MEQQIGDRILTLMAQQGYTQKKLANMVGVTEAAMSRYIRNLREPRLEVVAKLATTLHTTCDYLIRGENGNTDSK